jgi:hypothetical protein
VEVAATLAPILGLDTIATVHAFASLACNELVSMAVLMRREHFVLDETSSIIIKEETVHALTILQGLHVLGGHGGSIRRLNNIGDMRPEGAILWVASSKRVSMP